MRDKRYRATCPQGHPTPDASYRDAQGYCLRCRANGATAQRRQDRERIRLGRALEQMTPDALAEAIAALGAYPPVDSEV